MTGTARPAGDGDAVTAVVDALQRPDNLLFRGWDSVAEVAVRALTALGWRPPAPGTVTVNADDLRAAIDGVALDKSGGPYALSPAHRQQAADRLRAALPPAIGD